MAAYREVTDDIWTALRLCVGGLIMRYAQVEHRLDHIAVILFYYAGGKDYIEPGKRRPAYKHFPDPRKQKHILIERCFSSLASVQAFKAEWEELSKVLQVAENRRHAIVHGVWDGRITSDMVVTFGRVVTKRGKPEEEKLPVSIDGLRAIEVIADDLFKRLTDFADRLEKQFVPENER